MSEVSVPAFRGKVLATFFGDESFPVQWDSPEERTLMWWYDDLHCPNPVSPLWFDVGGWWHTCDYLFRRFGFPLAVDWKAKIINGYLYTAIVPADPTYAAQIGPYFTTVMPVYAANFLDWWRTRLRPEIERNFAYLDGYDSERATLPELLIHLEDALDIQERHWRIHWILNLAQFQASLDLQAAIKEVLGTVDQDLLGRILVSDEDRNWDAIRALWELKEQVKADPLLREAFGAETATEILKRLEALGPAAEPFRTALARYQREFGNKSIYAHEYIYPLWRENPAPIIEMIKSYLETDYDYPEAVRRVRETREAAIRELLARIPPENTAGRQKIEQALELALKMTPLTPDHHFYIDQGTYARLRLVFLAIGRKLAALGRLADPEDIFYLRYHEIRVVAANPTAIDARALVAERRAARERAFQLRPREWVGTVTEWDLYTEPYKSLWGYPEKFFRRQEAAVADVITGLAASAGVAEGVARVVASPAEFDQVRPGDILVCKMTSPAWIVVFTKIRGLVTDAGGVLSHPAVVSREFGIPAVVGTIVATQRIRSGDRIRVNGSEGRVEILR